MKTIHALLLVGASCLATAAIAQEGSGPQSPAGTSSASSASAPKASAGPDGGTASADGLEDIVVTARRREESLQAVPLAVQAFDGAALEERRIENATDLSKIVPALTSAQSSRDEENYVIRGQSGSGASISGQQVTVPTYIAQVPLPIGDGGGPGRYFDLQNIQVLKGPQGTLFGRNSTGGAVLFEPRRPGSEWGGYVELQGGNYDDRGVEGAFNIPVTSTLKIRLAGKYEDRDGYTKNVTNGQDLDDRHYYAGRLSILWQPTDWIENSFVADTLRSTTNGTSNLIAAVDPNAAIPRAFAGAVQAQLARQQALGPRFTLGSVLGLNKVRAGGFSNITTIELSDAVTLKNIVGLRRIKQLNRFDRDGTPLTLLDPDTCQNAAACNPFNPDEAWTLNLKQWSEELQLQGKLLDDKLTYTVGVFGSNTSTPDANYTHQTSVFGSVTDVNSFIRDRNRSVYGQISFDFSSLVEGLTGTAGYRRANDDRRLSTFQVNSGRCGTGALGTVVAQPGNPTSAAPCQRDVQSKSNADSYTFGFDWKVTNDALLYIVHRRGYRAGGFNPLAAPALLAVPAIPNAASLFTYDPEFLTDFEGGLKADWELGPVSVLRTNIAIFSQRLKGAQLNQTFSVGTATVSALTNASSAKIKGVEAEATLKATENLSFNAAWAHTSAKYGAYLDYNRRDPVTNAPLSFTGRIVPFTPKDKLNLGATFKQPLGDDKGELTFSTNYAYKSSLFLGLIPFINVAGGGTVYDGESKQKPTEVVDANVGWKGIMGTRIDADLYVTNLFNVTYKIGGASLINSGLGFNHRIYNEPRMYGVQLRYRFGG